MNEKPYETFAIQFQQTANQLAVLYGGHIYLVGGALRDINPRDYDLRVVLTDYDIERLFGVRESTPVPVNDQWTPMKWRWAYEQLKQNRQLYEQFKYMAYRFDLQIQSISNAERYADKPRCQLDSVPDEILKAGLP